MKPSDLKKWMERNQLSAVYVAAMAQVSQRTVERYLAAKCEPRAETVTALNKLVMNYKRPEHLKSQ